MTRELTQKKIEEPNQQLVINTSIKMSECPLGGDKNCKSCCYYPDFEWNEQKQDCTRKVK